MVLSREDLLPSMFRFIDESGVNGKTAEAHLVLGNDDVVTVRAGGPGIHSRPAPGGGYEQYEVLTDGVPPRFWSRYGDSAGVLFACVPRLLVSHLITRNGGITDIHCDVKTRQVFQAVDIRLKAEKGMAESAVRALHSMVGIELVSTLFSVDGVV